MPYDMIIQHPPSEIMIHGALITTVTGDICGGALQNKVRGQSRSIAPRSPGSDILVTCRHSQIFMAAKV